VIIPTQTIGYFCLVAGACMVAGWWVAFRNRSYLLLLGLFFLMLGTSVIVGDRLQTGQLPPLWRWVLRVTIAVALLALVAAVVTAVREARRRMEEVREHYRAASEALMEIARAKEQQRRDTQDGRAGKPEQSQSNQDGPS